MPLTSVNGMFTQPESGCLASLARQPDGRTGMRRLNNTVSLTPFREKSLLFKPLDRKVCEEQRCEEQVFPLAVSYLDRFLSQRSISRQQLQLLAVTAMLVASKFRQCNLLPIDLLCAYTDHSVQPHEVRTKKEAIKYSDKFPFSLGRERKSLCEEKKKGLTLITPHFRNDNIYVSHSNTAGSEERSRGSTTARLTSCG
ncbi:hypothetical protein EVAR_51866_1 [Eumeta japonica]|uniref:Cyclin-like domain-containing protein n=1 Tax=Eumeta variegata TaxID=151549 RepID=A0A4C1YRM3_EUMVA|nr:hypothetical protein EVAR_51866_1 [Eumeta japonica]